MRELERRQTSLQRNVSPDPRTFRRNWADWYNNIRVNANRIVRGATTSVCTFRGRSRSNMLSQLAWRLLPRVEASCGQIRFDHIEMCKADDMRLPRKEFPSESWSKFFGTLIISLAEMFVDLFAPSRWTVFCWW